MTPLDSPLLDVLPGDLDLSMLSPLQRILLSADGTLTTLLEVYLGERLGIVKLHEAQAPSPCPQPYLELAAGEPVITRQIMLQGRSSGKNWLFADSIIVPSRLEANFQTQLLNSRKPIGKLWLEYKTETFKEIVDARLESAGAVAAHFAIGEDEAMLARTYRVFCQRRPVMLISEKFPAAYFVGEAL